MTTASPELLGLTAQIVSAHCSNNQVEAGSLPGLIHQVFQALSSAGTPEATAKDEPAPQPAVPVKKSVFPDYIVCLEDGKKLTMLKRHLSSRYNMTPAQYRERWGLPSDYPMVAPNYAERRSALAREIGLGRKPANTEQKTEGEAAAPRGRRRKDAA
ncbi:MucR family transcriptional regulator [Rhizosaccharibacter radicis]|uniref:MucR family transcriptional regulator n=1 Tax=Rhizosaccharibacter radicis TaxID=2782605 RepID=A0ABT1W1J8_9PROT|nr:MucR family transcriptional regulator [Acetobacteraceae bacterium KSS12]